MNHAMLPSLILWYGSCDIDHVISCEPLQKAKKKPMTNISPSDLNVDISPRLKVLEVSEPPTREAGSKVVDVDELIAKLKEAGSL